MRLRVPGVLLALVLILGCRGEDACEPALERLDRIAASRQQPSFSARARAEAIEQCRNHPRARHDPVLRCAMDSPSDEAAASCVDEVVDRVLEPPAEPDGKLQGGDGINPLLDPGAMDGSR